MNEVNGNNTIDKNQMNVDNEREQDSHNQQNPRSHFNGINTENFKESIYSEGNESQVATD